MPELILGEHDDPPPGVHLDSESLPLVGTAAAHAQSSRPRPIRHRQPIDQALADGKEPRQSLHRITKRRFDLQVPKTIERALADRALKPQETMATGTDGQNSGSPSARATSAAFATPAPHTNTCTTQRIPALPHPNHSTRDLGG